MVVLWYIDRKDEGSYPCTLSSIQGDILDVLASIQVISPI